MSTRYRLALALGAPAFERLVKDDKTLLAEFGLGLLAVEGALAVAFLNDVKGGKVQPWHRAEIDGRVWDHLRPLLEELRDLRKERTRRELAKVEANS